jgi:hypothetical protein
MDYMMDCYWIMDQWDYRWFLNQWDVKCENANNKPTFGNPNGYGHDLAMVSGDMAVRCRSNPKCHPVIGAMQKIIHL